MLIKNFEFLRFVLTGIVNTFLSYSVYYTMQLIVSYQIAYFVAFIFGVMASYYMNTTFTFKETVDIRKFLKYPIVYFIQYSLGAVFLFAFVEYFRISKVLAPIVITIINIPITFTMTRYIIKGD